MYIQPNSIVRLLTNVPLDNTYAHTIYFGSKSAQVSYFEGKTKAGCIFSQQSYQRYAKGVIRLQKLADDIFDCNYMMFQNTAYGNRWFFAFINTVEYISNTVCEITYEIDVMQTWFFDVTLLQSFVEREHSRTDVAGDNIVPEPVTIGDYYNTAPISTELFDEFGLILCSPYKCVNNPGPIGNQHIWVSDLDGYPISINTIDNQRTCLFYTVLGVDEQYSESHIAQALYELNDEGKVENIVSIYPVPKSFLTNYNDLDVLSGTTAIKTFTYYNANEKPTTLGAYTPKNKKLLTYPYNKFVIETGDGTRNEFAFEFFGNNSVTFQIHANLLENVSFKAVPRMYKGAYTNFSESCLLTDFPQTGYVMDTYKAWLAQNKTRLAIQGVSSVLGIGSGLGSVMAGSQMLTNVTKVLSKKGAKMMAAGFDEIGRSGVGGIGNILSESQKASVAHSVPQGSADGSLEIVMGKKDFNGVQYYVNPKNAKIIDDFFNVYGYATHLVKVPNRNVRPHWTFVKTIDINVESNAPADDTNKICSIYDKGITFWRHANEVGNYSLDNSPVASNT